MIAEITVEAPALYTQYVDRVAGIVERHGTGQSTLPERG